MRYTCTTSKFVKKNLKFNGTSFITATAIDGECGADGNAMSKVDDITKLYGYKYDRDSDNETVFDKNHLADDEDNNVQAVTFSASYAGTDIVREEKFKKIGYSSTVPSAHLKDYKVKKVWEADTHQISDGLTVELWVWNDNKVQEVNSHQITRRTGALIDTQVLHADTDPNNNWTYTWKNLDDRLQYYVLEYYTKKKPNGELIYDDRGEVRKVLIGGTMPVFSEVPTKYQETGIYGFEVKLGDYPETFISSDGTPRIPIQTFNENDDLSDGKILPISHANSLTKDEKLASVENNARQYYVTYTLTKENSGKTNVITLNNSQVFDDRAYYVWLDHETELPEMIAQTYLEDGVKKSHALNLVKDTNHMLDDGSYCIKGLSVSSIDAAKVDNIEGNATSAFRIKDDNGKFALFTATNHGNYKTGTGTRTYQVKYVVDSATKNPVSITAGDGVALVLTDNPSVKVEEDSGYIVYSWFMTIHVYDVKPDGVLAYNPKGGPVVLQEALSPGTELKWTLVHDGNNYNSISYTSNDKRNTGILKNDIYRLPLYKSAGSPDMGSCADIVGVAYAGSKPVDDISTLKFEDTYESRYGSLDVNKTMQDDVAVAQGSNGFVEVDLNTPRYTRINRTQDHANYAKVTFTPNQQGAPTGEDVFYYKIVVFAEDNTYQYNTYDEIDASEGVMMYTYFTMKAKQDMPWSGWDKSGSSSGDGNDLTYTIFLAGNGDAAGIKLGSKTPKTGDENNLMLWFGMVVLAMAIIAFGVYKRKQTSE